MAYALGAVKPHVKRAADVLGPKHGYTVVYGWRAFGSVPNSDHPKGLALDFMGSNKARGDALVADLIANASAYGVKYIIWRGRIWQNGEWKPYSGPSNHYDHVHVSFNATAGSGAIDTVPVGFSAIPGADTASQIASLYGLFKEINRILKGITDPAMWKRAGYLVVGTVAVLIGIVIVLRGDTSDITKYVAKAAQYAKKGTTK